MRCSLLLAVVDDGTTAPWSTHEQALSQLAPRWDGLHQEYRNRDGGRLPELDEPVYTRAIWSPEYADAKVELTLERQTAQRVDVYVAVTRARRRGEGVFVLGDRRFEVDIRPNQSVTHASTIEIEVGQSVQFSYESGGNTQLGPLMTP